MDVWVPWDADEEEAIALLEIHDEIPKSLRPALLKWLHDELVTTSTHYGQWTDADPVLAIQSALRTDLGARQDYIDTAEVMTRITRQGDQFLLRVVDYQLARYQFTYAHEPSPVLNLSWHLDKTGSSLTVTTRDGAYRLARRIPAGVEEGAAEAVASAPHQAGVHLAQAWNAMNAIEADPGKAINESVKAVELAVAAVVIPADKKIRQGKLVQALKDKRGWKLTLGQREDGHPDHRAVVIGMLETLFLAQGNRHGGSDVTEQEARTAVFLATTLVGWFSSGAIVLQS